MMPIFVVIIRRYESCGDECLVFMSDACISPFDVDNGNEDMLCLMALKEMRGALVMSRGYSTMRSTIKNDDIFPVYILDERPCAKPARRDRRRALSQIRFRNTT
jgi:hypothetical protein